MTDALERFGELSPVWQLIVLTVLLDPAFGLAGYGLAPLLGVDPMLGLLAGVGVAAIPTVLIVGVYGTPDVDAIEG